MPEVFVYVVDRDFGFAPNPFHGVCTLATCKPGIRKSAGIGDWVIGMGGSRLNATGKCIFAMEVTEKISFDKYWSSPKYFSKRPVRNGSLKMLVGDNIYHHSENGDWVQKDSHHSNTDGSTNYLNLANDTSSDFVLISNSFFYFGSAAPLAPTDLLETLGYRNKIGYRRFSKDSGAMRIVEWIWRDHKYSHNQVIGDPFLFDAGAKRFAPRPKRNPG